MEECSHSMVNIQTWLCADCKSPIADDVKEKMRGASTKAPEGKLWVLMSGEQTGEENPWNMVEGVFTDRAIIARKLIQGYIYHAEDLRTLVPYQGSINVDLFEYWHEGEEARPRAYYLSLFRIDHGW